MHYSASVFIHWHSAQFWQLLANLTSKSQCQKQKWTWIERSRFTYVLILFPGLSKFGRCYMLKGKGLTANDVARTPQVHRFLNRWIWLLFMPTTNFVFTTVTIFPFHKGKRHLEQEMWKELKRNPYACSVKVAHPSGGHTHFNSFALMWQSCFNSRLLGFSMYSTSWYFCQYTHTLLSSMDAPVSACL